MQRPPRFQRSPPTPGMRFPPLFKLSESHKSEPLEYLSESRGRLQELLEHKVVECPFGGGAGE